MQFLKINCSQCSHYQECPQKTRMYVNYCGADIDKVKKEIEVAAIDCRERHGLLFTQTILSDEWKKQRVAAQPVLSS